MRRLRRIDGIVEGFRSGDHIFWVDESERAVNQKLGLFHEPGAMEGILLKYEHIVWDVAHCWQQMTSR